MPGASPFVIQALRGVTKGAICASHKGCYGVPGHGLIPSSARHVQIASTLASLLIRRGLVNDQTFSDSVLLSCIFSV